MHGTVLAFHCAQKSESNAVTSNNVRRNRSGLPWYSFIGFRPECAARGGAPGLASLR